jgi:hypothetical protein
MKRVLRAFFLGAGIWITMFGVATVVMLLFLGVAVRLHINQEDGFALWLGVSSVVACVSVMLMLPWIASDEHDRRMLLPWLIAAGLEGVVSLVNTALDLSVDYNGNYLFQETVWQLDALHILPLACLLLGYVWLLWTEPARLRDLAAAKTTSKKKTPAE